MEILLKQKFTYASIVIARNYSNIDMNRRSVLTEPIFNSVVISSLEKLSNDIGRFKTKETILTNFNKNKWDAHRSFNNFYHRLGIYDKEGSRRKFFYSKSGATRKNQEKIPLSLVTINRYIDGNSNGCSYETTNEKHIKKHYNNPFAGIKIYTIERTIKKDGDKITISLYSQRKERTINSIYFRKSSGSKTLTFNIKTGNFLVTTYNKPTSHKAVKNFFTNSFFSLEQALRTIFRIEGKISESSKINSEFKKELSNDLFRYGISKIFKTSFNEQFLNNSELLINSSNSSFIEEFLSEWIYKFVVLKQIKMSNDGFQLLKYHYPGEKYLKKNDRKFIASMLDKYGIKSNITIKIVHMYPRISISELKDFCVLFGEEYHKYLGNLPIEFFKRLEIPESNSLDYRIHEKYSIMQTHNEFMNKEIRQKEKENIIKILRSTLLVSPSQGTTNNVIHFIRDHIRMMQKIREFYPDRILSSTTFSTFMNEHSEISKLIEKIKKGWVTEYVYDENLINLIEEKMVIGFYPNQYDLDSVLGTFYGTQRVYDIKILKNSEEYSEEGSFMHHCVGSYINNDISLIISIRNDNERVTCEFNTKTKMCEQSRYFKNANPPAHFTPVIEKLIVKIKNYPFSIHPIDKIKKRVILNGKEVPVEEPAGIFNEYV